MQIFWQPGVVSSAYTYVVADCGNRGCRGFQLVYANGLQLLAIFSTPQLLRMASLPLLGSQSDPRAMKSTPSHVKGVWRAHLTSPVIWAPDGLKLALRIPDGAFTLRFADANCP